MFLWFYDNENNKCFTCTGPGPSGSRSRLGDTRPPCTPCHMTRLQTSPCTFCWLDSGPTDHQTQLWRQTQISAKTVAVVHNVAIKLFSNMMRYVKGKQHHFHIHMHLHTWRINWILLIKNIYYFIRPCSLIWCLNLALCTATVIWLTMQTVFSEGFIAGPTHPHIQTTHCFRALATIHNNAGQAMKGGSWYGPLKGTGNGADINRKFPGEANSNRKWSGPGLDKGRRSSPWQRGMWWIRTMGLAGVCAGP